MRTQAAYLADVAGGLLPLLLLTMLAIMVSLDNPAPQQVPFPMVTASPR